MIKRMPGILKYIWYYINLVHGWDGASSNESDVRVYFFYGEGVSEGSAYDLLDIALSSPSGSNRERRQG